MNEDKLSRKWLWVYALGLIPVFWLALLIAPYMDGGLPKLIANADAAFANPFAIRWCEDTPRTILFLSMIYMVCIGIYLSDDRNYRRREEYGSAKWGSVVIVNGKYSTKKDEDPFFNKILTQNVRISFWCWRHRRNLNILVIGGSGAGKTRFYVIPNVLNANSILPQHIRILLIKGDEYRFCGGFAGSVGFVEGIQIIMGKNVLKHLLGTGGEVFPAIVEVNHSGIDALIGQRIACVGVFPEDAYDIGISMENMAAKLDVTTNYLGKIERGMRCPSLGFVIRLSRILGISTDYLLMGEQEAEKSINEMALTLAEQLVLFASRNAE